MSGANAAQRLFRAGPDFFGTLNPMADWNWYLSIAAIRDLMHIAGRLIRPRGARQPRPKFRRVNDAEAD